jgi:GT2 family glycosyltransferase
LPQKEQVMRITVAIATLGRPNDVGRALLDLMRQTVQPDRVIISATTADDIDAAALAKCELPVEVIYGPKGLTRQRNRVLVRLRQEDVLLFLDDDFVLAADYLSRLSRLFRNCPDVMIATGDVLADGIGGAGLSWDEAHELLAAPPLATHTDPVTINNGYGCNMAFRVVPIRVHGLRFDETLPLYGWLEDVDFSRKVAAYGRCVKSKDLRGVHLGSKAGRTSGIKLGYSQVVNPIYLTRRATMQWGHALSVIARNIIANVTKSLRPEPWVDRRGRLRGNFLAIGDVLRGRIDPMRVLTLEGKVDGQD